MGNLADKALAEMPVAAEADFDYPEHMPEWLEAGSALICTVCGMVVLGEEQATEPGVLLPTGVIFGGGPVLDAEAEEFYRQEQQS